MHISVFMTSGLEALISANSSKLGSFSSYLSAHLGLTPSERNHFSSKQIETLPKEAEEHEFYYVFENGFVVFR